MSRQAAAGRGGARPARGAEGLPAPRPGHPPRAGDGLPRRARPRRRGAACQQRGRVPVGLGRGQGAGGLQQRGVLRAEAPHALEEAVRAFDAGIVPFQRLLRRAGEHDEQADISVIAHDLLADWDKALGRISLVMPRDYARVLNAIEKANREGLPVDQYVMEVAALG